MLSVESEWTLLQRDSCSSIHEPAVGNEREARRRKEHQSFPALKSKAKIGGETNQGNRGSSSSDKRRRIPCRFITCNNPTCDFRHLPEFQNYKSNTGCRYGYKCHFRHVEAEDKLNKKSKKSGAEGQVALLKETIQLCCVSQDSHPRKSTFTESRENGIKSRR